MALSDDLILAAGKADTLQKRLTAALSVLRTLGYAFDGDKLVPPVGPVTMVDALDAAEVRAQLAEASRVADRRSVAEAVLRYCQRKIRDGKQWENLDPDELLNEEGV